METHGVVVVDQLLVSICFILWIMMISIGTAWVDDGGEDCLEAKVHEGVNLYKTQFQAEGQCTANCVGDNRGYWGYLKPKVDSPIHCVCCTGETEGGDCTDFVKFGDCVGKEPYLSCDINCKYNIPRPQGSLFGYCDSPMDCFCCIKFDQLYNSVEVEEDDDGSDIIGPGLAGSMNP